MARKNSSPGKPKGGRPVSTPPEVDPLAKELSGPPKVKVGVKGSKTKKIGVKKD